MASCRRLATCVSNPRHPRKLQVRNAVEAFYTAADSSRPATIWRIWKGGAGIHPAFGLRRERTGENTCPTFSSPKLLWTTCPWRQVDNPPRLARISPPDHAGFGRKQRMAVLRRRPGQFPILDARPDQPE